MALSVATAAMSLAPAGVGDPPASSAAWTTSRCGSTTRSSRRCGSSPWAGPCSSQLDLLLVGVLATSADVATYAVPFRLALFVGFPLIVVNQVVPPLIASWHAGGAVERLERTLRATAGLAFIGSLRDRGALRRGRQAHHRRAVRREVRGRLHRPAHPLRRARCSRPTRAPAGSRSMMTGHQRAYAWLLGVSTVVTAALDVACFQVWGIEGIALATAVSLTIQNFVQAADAAPPHRVPLDRRRAPRHDRRARDRAQGDASRPRRGRGRRRRRRQVAQGQLDPEE